MLGELVAMRWMALRRVHCIAWPRASLALLQQVPGSAIPAAAAIARAFSSDVGSGAGQAAEGPSATHSASTYPGTQPPVAGLPPRLLLRDFLQQSLYHPTLGYFNRPSPVVGSLPEPINYWKLANSWEWRLVMERRYRELGSAWLTPAEMFSPWYGAVIARHIMEHRKHHLRQEGSDLEILEVGGGNGTLAKDVLDWLRVHYPAEYGRTTYTCIEISPRLAAKQYELVVAAAGHANRFQVVQGNAWDRASWGAGPNFRHCFVLMMEVLDNLPHDRVERQGPQAPWQQVAVALAAGCSTSASMETGPWEVVLEPVSDPLIERSLPLSYKPPTLEDALDKRLNRLLDYLLAKEPEPDHGEGPETLYLPTACLALLDVLHAARPNHSLIAADFDQLPDVKLPGRNAPLVSAKVDGVNKDYDTLLVPWGSADIFFPTDFDALSRLYLESAERAWGANGRPPPRPPASTPALDSAGQVAYAHYNQGAVLKRYREMEKTATLMSFNPMVNDFKNARFFLGDAYGRRPAAHAAEPISPTAAAPAALAPAPTEPSQPQRDSPQRTSPAELVEFSWQYGYGKGMQHAAAGGRVRRPLGPGGKPGRTPAAALQKLQHLVPPPDSGQPSGGAGRAGGTVPSPAAPPGPAAHESGQTKGAAAAPPAPEPSLGGRHLRRTQTAGRAASGEPDDVHGGSGQPPAGGDASGDGGGTRRGGGAGGT